MGLHSYVRLNGLEVEGHPQHFRCDDALKAVSDSYRFSGIDEPRRLIR
jgi:hypothetical protein